MGSAGGGGLGHTYLERSSQVLGETSIDRWAVFKQLLTTAIHFPPSKTAI